MVFIHKQKSTRVVIFLLKYTFGISIKFRKDRYFD